MFLANILLLYFEKKRTIVDILKILIEYDWHINVLKKKSVGVLKFLFNQLIRTFTVSLEKRKYTNNIVSISSVLLMLAMNIQVLFQMKHYVFLSQKADKDSCFI